jgi:hypothetical protein
MLAMPQNSTGHQDLFSGQRTLVRKTAKFAPQHEYQAKIDEHLPAARQDSYHEGAHPDIDLAKPARLDPFE